MQKLRQLGCAAFRQSGHPDPLDDQPGMMTIQPRRSNPLVEGCHGAA
jgi:hypothetical protein